MICHTHTHAHECANRLLIGAIIRLFDFLTSSLGCTGAEYSNQRNADHQSECVQWFHRHFSMDRVLLLLVLSRFAEKEIELPHHTRTHIHPICKSYYYLSLGYL